MLWVCVSTAHSIEEGGVQVIQEVHTVLFEETGGYETAPATSMGCVFT